MRYSRAMNLRSSIEEGVCNFRPKLAKAPFLAFAFAFFIPVALTLGVIWYNKPTRVTEELFPSSLKIDSSLSHIELSGSSELSPSEDKDFFVSAWFRLDRPLSDGQKVTLLSKTDASGGYAISLVGVHDTLVRPTILWKDGESGKWYPMSDVELPIREWFVIGLEFYKGKYLGGHFGVWDPIKGRGSLNTLGGHELSVHVTPKAHGAPVVVGPPPKGAFRGSVGPVLIAQRKGLNRDLPAVFKEIARMPKFVPDTLDSDDVVVWLPKVPTKVPAIINNGIVVNVRDWRESDKVITPSLTLLRGPLSDNMVR